jgi:hypothetical protein
VIMPLMSYFFLKQKSPPQVSATLNRLGFFLISQVASCGASGGLALSWRPGIDLECFLTTKNTISAWCYSDPPHSPWILSCVYGPPDRRDRQAFWDSFTAVGDNFDPTWLCIGDFNAVLSQDEKMGGRPIAISANSGFKSFINHFGMVDLGFAGNPFTWSNLRLGAETIKERLDRGLATSNWILLHPEYSLLHIPAHNSDHNPISLNTNSQSPFLPRPFRFEEFWSKDPSCGKTIETAWKRPVFGNPSSILPKKLTITKKALLKWNHTHFGKIHQKIKANLQ